jgi:sugar lactone lactonase YvrE/DNA-directed RNA polymerase subunit RPC12/RpoP
MPTESFACPNCGAPLEAHDIKTSTIRCPYCSTSVIVPEELRQKPKTNPVVKVTSTITTVDTPPKNNAWILGLFIGVTLLVLAIVMIPMIIASTATQGVSRALSFLTTETATPTLTPTPTITPTPSPTPAYMVPDLSFGGEGIGPGLFNDARYIDLDQQGTVFVADYEGGRVQAFDTNGKYLRQWQLGDKNTIIAGLAADRQGWVFVSVGNGIAGVDGQTGEIVEEIVNPAGGTYGDLQIDAQGRLATTWYEGRWGIITSLEGHREGLIFYDAKGKQLLDVPSFISAQTDSLALDIFITVDGQGTIYALSDGTIFKFSPEGKYLDRWDISTDVGGGSALVVDGQGRVFVAGNQAVFIYSPDGRLEKQFPVESIWDMALDDAGNLWVVGREKVTRYIVSDK